MQFELDAYSYDLDRLGLLLKYHPSNVTIIRDKVLPLTPSIYRWFCSFFWTPPTLHASLTFAAKTVAIINLTHRRVRELPLLKEHYFAKKDLICEWNRTVGQWPTFSLQIHECEFPLSDFQLPVIIPNDFFNWFACFTISENQLPLVIRPQQTDLPALQGFMPRIALEQLTTNSDIKNAIKVLMGRYGALLFRGFPIEGAAQFDNLFEMVLGTSTPYQREESKGEVLKGRFFSSTKIPPHNALSCTLAPPKYVALYCGVPPQEGSGQTLLARTQEVSDAVKKSSLWNRFHKQTAIYISRYPKVPHNPISRINAAHPSWKESFGTENTQEVESICNQRGWRWRWLPSQWLEISQEVPITRLDRQDEPLWFNQVHLYQANPKLYGGWKNYLLAQLLYIIPGTRQYDVWLKNSTSFSRKEIYQIYDILEKAEIRLTWQKKDLLLIDNLQVMHGRDPSQGQYSIFYTQSQATLPSLKEKNN